MTPAQLTVLLAFTQVDKPDDSLDDFLGHMAYLAKRGLVEMNGTTSMRLTAKGRDVLDLLMRWVTESQGL